MTEFVDKYRNELLLNVMPFWEKNSVDHQFGGFFSCLDRDGTVFDTDKFMWLQGRQIWTLSTLYNQVEENPVWRDMAEQGAKFILKNGRDAEGDWYFSLDRAGNPLVQPYNIFSDCFASMGLAALYKATGKEEYGKVAEDTFNRILERQHNPKGKYSKAYPGTRNLKGFALPMILSNLSLELEHIVGSATVETLIDEVIHEVMEVFYQPETGLIMESVNLDGSFSDTFDGRLVNPGHTIEAMWFMMDLAERRSDKALMTKCVDIALRALEYGWDEQYGGIFYFKDILNKPLLQLEWDQKLWWVHLEALVCMAKGWAYTGDPRCKEWFEKLDSYSFQHFADPEFGEWYGYLNRQGEPLLTLKGGKWKGCFHVPRALLKVYKTMETIPVYK
ncbi:AGE family epimerase/isomerase [Sphingobacterium psychroaquaticum]|uniref:N-acylglucosamine 2-epimerase n=1 Tax=Sphingobacterium psychroaquaticum TaxID=561061 RepID=A0A1X7KIF0_9SPHI|nr:AGE family epimerase/isomerase [Sphingobacterium psychroaquaticum]QBQ42761.1 AGE family epimerase/isomerase [Sphingobacterium psychroaquaticum]SMG40739.1 N-acylglucosamine 2-epimerase [Sphingobacterium psychroaquaticum]